MDVFQIEGPVRLEGDIEVNGSKNASLPIMAAALLGEGKSELLGVPDLADISVFGQLLEQLGCPVARPDGRRMVIDATRIDNPFGPTTSSARCGRASASWARCWRGAAGSRSPCPAAARSATGPSTCTCWACGHLGAQIHLKSGYVIAEAPQGPQRGEHLPGRPVRLDRPRHGQRHDGGDPGQGPDDHRIGGLRAGGRRPGQLPQRDGRPRSPGSARRG